MSALSEHQLGRRNQEFCAVSMARNVASGATSSSPTSTISGVYLPPQVDRGAAGLSNGRPSSGRRSPLVPIDDAETQQLERTRGAMIAQRLLDRDRAAATAGGSGVTFSGSATPAPVDTMTRKVAALRAGAYLPTPEKSAPVGRSTGGDGEHLTPIPVPSVSGSFESGSDAATVMPSGTGGTNTAASLAWARTTPAHVDTAAAMAAAQAGAAAAAAAAGVPAHLLDHLHAPDREVFELKAKVNALAKQLQAAGDQRDEALRVAATTDARAKASSANAANKLDKVRVRAEAAERAAGANDLRAEASEAAARSAKQRTAAAEAQVQKQTTLVAQLEEEIEEQRAIGVTLEDDVEGLRRRVLEHERGVSTLSRSSQTVKADLEAAAKANDLDAPEQTTSGNGGFRARANAWLRDLEGVGADAHLDTSGMMHRASARLPRAPRGLGRDLPPPAESHLLGAAGYSFAAAAAEMSLILERDLVPAVDRMFQRQLPLREEIRALVEDEVMPLVEPTIVVMQQKDLQKDILATLPLSWMLAERDVEDAEHGRDGEQSVGVTISREEGVVDEGWGPDVDSDQEEQEREEREQEQSRVAWPGSTVEVRDTNGFPAQMLKGKTFSGTALGRQLFRPVPGGDGGLMGATPSLPTPKGSTSSGGGGSLGMTALKVAKWASAKFTTRARAKRGSKTEMSLLKAKEEDRLMEHIQNLMVKAENAPTEALRKKLRNYIADVVHTAVADGVLKKEEARNLTAGQEEQQWAGGGKDYHEGEYSEGDEGDLHDTPHDSECADSDTQDDGEDSEWGE
eukprot:CAMPEP_0181355188 /NCGR_PEP_ID=MMETSP1106-20121128/3763_1 /TAXON_ID=81844 /ORGANISM="Mantoniella antarctica, Strain SL-175" /LENGTH=796 /DNA_ID=CAMNT_0023467905 /DNA_START=277 /DNA_END=2667 /DNA_ORIENTATION=+